MSALSTSPVVSLHVDPDDGMEEDGPVLPWLPPDDRLWRHPSELATSPLPGPVAVAARDSRVWTVALLAGVIGALLASGVGVAVGNFQQSTTVVRPVERVVDSTIPPLTTASSPKQSDVAAIADQLRPAMVGLLVDGNNGKGNASGIIFRSDGYVLTSNHVVDGATSIVAVLYDGQEVKGQLIGSDEKTDIAVVKLQGGARPVATLGSASALKVGQPVVAVGSPLGSAGGPSVTVGVVSALGREVDPNGNPPLLDMIETDAPIAPGGSGGALADGEGSVIGIMTSMVDTDQGRPGVGFATPIDVGHDVADQLIASGHVTHPWLGVEGDDVDGMTANALGIAGGALVQKVVGNSPAGKGGIQTSDVIVQIDNQLIRSMGGLVSALRGYRPGDRITVHFFHDRSARVTTLVVAERPTSFS